MKAYKVLFCAILLFAPALISSCGSESPQTGSQTNWLRSCETSAECGDLKCLCGTCTVSCAEEAQCSGLGLGTCAEPTDSGVVALCDGSPPAEGMCVARCDDTECPSDTSCVAGICVGSREATAQVTIDASIRYQALIGFGASLGYGEESIVAHPLKAELFDAMFVESGFEMIRLRNAFEEGTQTDFSSTSEIISEATTRLGHAPTLFMTSGSPPASLKANGDRFCGSSDVDCTLARDAGGGFDYAGFAEHWRASLQAYEAAGIHPDFVSIQNNPDWIPVQEAGPEACRFLPQEGLGTVIDPEGMMVEAEFPGYVEALDAVSEAVSTLDEAYVFSGPEVGSVVMVGPYADALSGVDALAFHPYGTETDNIVLEQLQSVRTLAETAQVPVIQSEMQSGGVDTAILAHYSLTEAGASAYLQLSFVGAIDEESSALIGADGETYQTLPAYHALAHFARSTDPGWVRVDAAADSSELLASAWISPDEEALTLVVVNGGDTAVDVELALTALSASFFDAAEVTRTVFDGIERSADLGALSKGRTVRVPGRSIVTVAALLN